MSTSRWEYPTRYWLMNLLTYGGNNMVKCSRCKTDIISHTDFTTGYARYGKSNKILCYACCGEMDERYMNKTGKITLYLCKKKDGRYKVSNWPDSLAFNVTGEYYTNHFVPNVWYNIKKHHVWFKDRKGMEWYGYSIGDNTQICHCRRLKSR